MYFIIAAINNSTQLRKDFLEQNFISEVLNYCILVATNKNHPEFSLIFIHFGACFKLSFPFRTAAVLTLGPYTYLPWLWMEELLEAMEEWLAALWAWVKYHCIE